jgi:hypothetical protein
MPGTVNIYIRSLKPLAIMSFSHTASLCKLLLPSLNAVVIRLSHVIHLSSRRTWIMNSNFHPTTWTVLSALWQTLYWLCRTRNQSCCPITIVGMHVQLVSVKLGLQLTANTNFKIFTFLSCKVFGILAFIFICPLFDGMENESIPIIITKWPIIMNFI